MVGFPLARVPLSVRWMLSLSPSLACQVLAIYLWLLFIRPGRVRFDLFPDATRASASRHDRVVSPLAFSRLSKLAAHWTHSLLAQSIRRRSKFRRRHEGRDPCHAATGAFPELLSIYHLFGQHCSCDRPKHGGVPSGPVGFVLHSEEAATRCSWDTSRGVLGRASTPQSP